MHCAAACITEVSNHFAVVDYMKEALSLTIQRAGSFVLPPQLQIGIMWKGVMSSIKGKFMELAGRA